MQLLRLYALGIFLFPDNKILSGGSATFTYWEIPSVSLSNLLSRGGISAFGNTDMIRKDFPVKLYSQDIRVVDDEHVYMRCRLCGEVFNYAQGYGKHTECENAISRLNRSPEQKMRAKWEYQREKKAPKVFKRDGYTCNHCGTSDNLTVDHIKPIIKGGTNELSNLQTLCGSCNSKKGGR